MFSRCSAENGVSRGTRISLRPSLSITSAARSMRVSESPAATAASVPTVQGQMTIASGGLEPEATGANQSSRRKREVQLLLGDHVRRLRVQKVDLRVRAYQALDEPQAVGHPGGAGQGDGDGRLHAGTRCRWRTSTGVWPRK